MNAFDARRLVALYDLPGGAAVNAEALMLDYGYPLESAVERAMDWHRNSQRITALGH
jgi:hypothetical protein